MQEQAEQDAKGSPEREGVKGSSLANPSVSRRSLLGAAVSGVIGGLAHGVAGPTAKSASADFVAGNLAMAANRFRSPDSDLKRRARDDYRCSLTAYGGQLSSPVGRLFREPPSGRPYTFDVAVIGSGYGASVCAARLAESLSPGGRLCVLERGREWIPGTFPDRLRDTTAESRFFLMGRRKGEVDNPMGLFDINRNDEIHVVNGNGLGGGSLINASVAVRPDVEVFRDWRWPVALRERELLDPYFDRAAFEMNVQVEPLDSTPKMVALREAANRMECGTVFKPAMVTAIHRNRGLGPDGRNRQGMIQRACTACGDCTTGCNVGAKSTLQMTYLPLAKRLGAEIFTQVEVRWIEKCDGFYRLHLMHHTMSKHGVQSVKGTATARLVILGAGSFGSTEILLRSQRARFVFSPTIGCNWSGNGDAIGFVTKTTAFVNNAGYGAYRTKRPPVGPTIQTNTFLNRHRPWHERMLVQEGTAARAYANAIGTLMHDLDMDHTMVLLAMGHDGNGGRITLDEQGGASLKWEGAMESTYRKRIRSHFDKMGEALGGRYRYLKVFGKQLITVHPLGGCNMSDDPLQGVTNDRGQVFDGCGGGFEAPDGTGAAVHEGLYVADSAAIPLSLGANPLMTLCALAERISERIACERAHADMFQQVTTEYS